MHSCHPRNARLMGRNSVVTFPSSIKPYLLYKIHCPKRIFFLTLSEAWCSAALPTTLLSC